MLIGLRFNFQLALDGAGDSVTWVVVIGYERGNMERMLEADTSSSPIRRSWKRHLSTNSSLMPLRTKIDMIEHTGLTGMHRPVRPVKVTLSKFRFYITIA